MGLLLLLLGHKAKKPPRQQSLGQHVSIINNNEHNDAIPKQAISRKAISNKTISNKAISEEIHELQQSARTFF